MQDKESQSNDKAFRSIEAEFRSRPDHQPVEINPPLITMPDEVTFQLATDQRIALEKEQSERNQVAYREIREREKREKRVGRLKKVIAAAAIFATYHSGGLIDMAGDQATDAGNVVADALQVQPFETPDEMDGIPFEEYSAEVQEEMKAEGQRSVEDNEKIRDTFVELFTDIDTNGADGLIHEVETYKADHHEKFVTQEKILETYAQIEKSDTNTEVITNLNDFMDEEYGIKATYGADQFGETSPFDDDKDTVKDIAKAYVEVFAALPKDFVSLAGLESIQISNQIPINDKGSVMGDHSSNPNEIRLFVHSPTFNAVVSTIEKMPYVGEMSYQSTVAHELGHALDDELILPVTNTKVEANGMSFSQGLEQAARTVIYREERPTVYAADSGKEHSAEVLAGLLAKDSTGLAETDEWRRFGSESNKNMIRMLGQLEIAYPGIGKILVANRLSDN